MELNKEYKKLTNKHAPSSPIIKNSLLAFLAGGFICFSGELLQILFSLAVPKKDAYTYVTLFFILLSSILTALGIFDKIARIVGAGTLVPVTGFSNSVTSAAIDTRAEGFVLGVGSKIFTVAGPVILYAVFSGTVYGIFHYLYLLFRSLA